MNTWDWVLKLIQRLVWPAALIIVLHMFQPAITQLIARVNGVTSKVVSVTFSQLEEIRQSLPLPKVDALPAAREIHKALKLPPKNVEKVSPCEGEIRIVDNLNPGPLDSVRSCLHTRVFSAVTRLADLHTHLLQQIDSAPDVPGVIAFLQNR